jgi:hypothetical protein
MADQTRGDRTNERGSGQRESGKGGPSGSQRESGQGGQGGQRESGQAGQGGQRESGQGGRLKSASATRCGLSPTAPIDLGSASGPLELSET